MRKGLTVVFSMMIIMLLVAGCGKSPDYTVSGEGIWQEYMSNSKASDEKYKGKIVSVTGRVLNTGVELGEGGKKIPFVIIYQSGKGLAGSVVAQLANMDDIDGASGKSITVKGVCAGMVKYVGNRSVIMIEKASSEVKR